MKVFLASLLGLLGLGYLVAWVHPTTRPYAKRYWWLVVLALTFVLGMVAATPRRKAKSGTTAVPQPDLRGIDAVYKKAVDGLGQAEVALARRRLEAQLTDTAAADRLHTFDAAVNAARREPDIERRRAAIAALVAEARRH